MPKIAKHVGATSAWEVVDQEQASTRAPTEVATKAPEPVAPVKAVAKKPVPRRTATR